MKIEVANEGQSPGSSGVAMLPEDLARNVAEPTRYSDMEAWHKKMRVVRKDYPFARGELDDYDPFWVVSRHADIQEITRKNDLFLSGGLNLVDKEIAAARREQGLGFRSLPLMNRPDHMKHRVLLQPWFQPKNLKARADAVRALARRHVDKMMSASGEIDFKQEIGLHYPLLVLMSMLGIPEEEEPFMLRLTQEYFGGNDPELTRTSTETSADIQAGFVEVIQEYSRYFGKLTESRRLNPTEDYSSVIANAKIDGEYMSDADILGHFISLAVAGHDTTSSSLAGGLAALATRPGELAKVKADPSLIPSLVNESIRWTSPVYMFVRHAAEDTEFRGQFVAKGEQVVLSFASANRDEDVFDAPFEFRVDRHPNPHVAFGYGPHLCLGMHLSMLELTTFYEELLPRLASLELAAEPEYLITNWVGGIKNLRLRVKAA